MVSKWIFYYKRKHEHLMWNIVLMNFANQESSRTQQAREFGKFQLFLLALKICRERIPAFQPFFYQDIRKARSKPGKFLRLPSAVSSGPLKTAETFRNKNFLAEKRVGVVTADVSVKTRVVLVRLFLRAWDSARWKLKFSRNVSVLVGRITMDGIRL